MNLEKYPYENIIKAEKTLENKYDIEIQYIEKLRKYSSFECHIVVYPYSRKISSENIKFNPFEEYVKDIQLNQKSAYFKIKSDFNKNGEWINNSIFIRNTVTCGRIKLFINSRIVSDKSLISI